MTNMAASSERACGSGRRLALTPLSVCCPPPRSLVCLCFCAFPSASGCTEAFDLLFSYPYRILNPPDATLADLGLEAGASLLQRPYSELPPPSAIRAKADATLTIGGGASSSYTAAAATKR